MNKKRIAYVALFFLIILGCVIYLFLAKPPMRVELYDAGAGVVDAEVKSMGDRVVVKFGPNGAGIAPFWKQPNVDIRIQDDLTFQGKKRQRGERLGLDRNDEIVAQNIIQTWMNELRYRAWKLRQPKEPARRLLFVRAKEVHLRSNPGEPPDAGTVSFGDALQPFEQRGEWIKVTSTGLKPKARGWLHNAVVATDSEHIEHLRTENRIPALVLLITAEELGKLATTTLAGAFFFSEGDINGETTGPKLGSMDCIVFAEGSVPHLPKPFVFMGQTIEKPASGRIYLVNRSLEIETYDLVSFK